MKKQIRNSIILCAAFSTFVFITAGISGCSKDASKGKGGSKELTVTVYAYCPCNRCNSYRWKGMVATGQKMKTLLDEGKNICAADPDVIPLGSTITYEGKDYFVADRGSKIKGNTINILLDNHKAVYDFGVKKDQTITVK